MVFIERKLSSFIWRRNIYIAHFYLLTTLHLVLNPVVWFCLNLVTIFFFYVRFYVFYDVLPVKKSKIVYLLKDFLLKLKLKSNQTVCLIFFFSRKFCNPQLFHIRFSSSSIGGKDYFKNKSNFLYFKKFWKKLLNFE